MQEWGKPRKLRRYPNLTSKGYQKCFKTWSRRWKRSENLHKSKLKGLHFVRVEEANEPTTGI